MKILTLNLVLKWNSLSGKALFENSTSWSGKQFQCQIPLYPKLRSYASSLSEINSTLSTNFINEKRELFSQFCGPFSTKFLLHGDFSVSRRFENGVDLEKMNFRSHLRP